MLLIVPSDPLRPKAPDAHFVDEFRAARDLGVEVALVDHDLLEREAAVRAVRSIPQSDDVVYRGWMLRREQYQALAEALTGNGSTLRTGPEQYRRAHELPGWYAALAAQTAESMWTVGADIGDFDMLCRTWASGRAVIRDYSKSMKHRWTEAMYLPDLADPPATAAVAVRFLELRGDALVGGLVLRRFEDYSGDEVRTWWIDGECALVTPHPDTPDSVSFLDTTPFAENISALELPFVTVDFALRADGVWRVVELGDGQVSDRPRATPAEALIGKLLRSG